MELQRNITAQLGTEMRAPRVTVELVAATSNMVHVLGRVDRPGSYPAGAFMTVSQALAAAGGAKDDASLSNVVVLHRDGAHTVSVIRVRMDRILKGEALLDIPVSRFDIVYVPRGAVGDFTVFAQGLIEPLAVGVNGALQGWELLNLDRVFITRVIKQ